LKKIHISDGLRGGYKTGWKVDFDFVFCSKHNYLKILEGKYDGKLGPKPVAEEFGEFLKKYEEGEPK